MFEAGQRSVAARGALEFADLLRLSGPRLTLASYVTTGVYSTFKILVCAIGKRPASSFLLSSLCSSAHSLSPLEGWKRGCLSIPCAVHCDPTAGHLASTIKSAVDPTYDSTWRASAPRGRTT